MDHRDFSSRKAENPSTAAVKNPQADPESSLWAQFAEATDAEALCQSWLALQCRQISGVQGALVLLGKPDTGPFTPIAVWPTARRNMQYLTPTAEKALVERQGQLIKPELADQDDSSINEHYEVAYPIEVDAKLCGVVVLDVTPRPEQQLMAVLRQLHWGAAWLEVLFWRQEATQDATSRQQMQSALDMTATALEHERFQAASTALATALATNLECDRVSIGFLKRSAVRVRAMSHSANFKKEANLIRAIEAAMDEALDQQATVVYPAQSEEQIQIIRTHEALAQQHGSGAICTIPLGGSHAFLGALTLERSADRPFDRPTVEMCEAVSAIVAPILDSKRKNDQWLIRKIFQACGRLLGKLFGPRHLAFKLSTLVLAGLIVLFSYAQGDYRIAATTTLEGLVQRVAVAPFSSYVADTSARAGDLVHDGDVLCVMDDRDLRLERLKWSSEKAQLVKQYREAMAKHDRAKIRIVKAKTDQAEAQIALLDEQLARTRITAPFDGVIVSGDLSQALGAPVERGQVLFEIAPLNAYRVILEVDESDIARIREGQRGELVLSSMPGERFPFIVEKITPVSTSKEGLNFFRVEAKLENISESLRPGMEGIGKIMIDRRKLIWIGTHKMINWLRLKLWRWWP